LLAVAAILAAFSYQRSAVSQSAPSPEPCADGGPVGTGQWWSSAFLLIAES
jgi:hypothetical protein